MRRARDQRLRGVATLSWLGLAIGACAGTNLPTGQPSNPRLAAILGPVTLRAAQIGPTPCVWVERQDGVRLALVWPADDPTQLLGSTVSRRDGSFVAQDGDTVWLGGGTLAEGQPIPAGCPVTGVFLVGDLFHEPPFGSGTHEVIPRLRFQV